MGKNEYDMENPEGATESTDQWQQPPEYGDPGQKPPDRGDPGQRPPDYGDPGQKPPDRGDPGQRPPDYGDPGQKPPDYGDPGQKPPPRDPSDCKDDNDNTAESRESKSATLLRLRQELAAAQSNIEAYQQQSKMLEDDLKTLQQSADEIEPLVTKYKDAHSDLKDRQVQLKAYAEHELDEIEQQLSDGSRKEIDGLIANNDSLIADLEKKVKELSQVGKLKLKKLKHAAMNDCFSIVPPSNGIKDSVQCAEVRQKNAQVRLTRAQDRYDDLKNLTERVTGYLDAADKLKVMMEEEEDKRAPESLCKRYYLAKELHKGLGQDDSGEDGPLAKAHKALMGCPVAQYRIELEDAWYAVYMARQTVRAAEEELKRRQGNLERYKKNLQEANEKSQESILTQISAVLCMPAASPTDPQDDCEPEPEPKPGDRGQSPPDYGDRGRTATD
jgi:hypothetical protein